MLLLYLHLKTPFFLHHLARLPHLLPPALLHPREPPLCNTTAHPLFPLLPLPSNPSRPLLAPVPKPITVADPPPTQLLLGCLPCQLSTATLRPVVTSHPWFPRATRSRVATRSLVASRAVRSHNPLALLTAYLVPLGLSIVIFLLGSDLKSMVPNRCYRPKRCGEGHRHHL